MSQNMRKDFVEVDCINDGDAASHTNEQVEQSHVIVPFADRFVSSVVELVQMAKMDDPEAKIVVFFPTARMVSFFAELFNVGLKIPVIELHSRKTQSYRNRMSETFRNADSGVLFTSDVSARGKLQCAPTLYSDRSCVLTSYEYMISLHSSNIRQALTIPMFLRSFR